MIEKMREDFGKILARIVGQERVNILSKRAIIGAKITKGRNHLKTSQQELANQIGVEKLVIEEIEDGVVSPDTVILRKIPEALHVPLDRFENKKR